jgi:hypothetical protein
VTDHLPMGEAGMDLLDSVSIEIAGSRRIGIPEPAW